MIDDAMIKRLAVQCGLWKNYSGQIDVLYLFAIACYTAGQEDQRRNDAAWLDSFGEGHTVFGKLAEALRLNKEPPDHTPVEPREVYSPNTIVL